MPARFIFGPCVVAFGLSAALVAVCGGCSGLMTLRFLLRCGEGILTMGILYLGQWYRLQELALRYGQYRKNCQQFARLIIAGIMY